MNNRPCNDSCKQTSNYSTKRKKQITIQNKSKLSVEDMVWNPGEDYLLVAFKDGSMKLYEMDKEESDIVIQDFGGKDWFATYKKAMERGLKHA